MLSAKTIGSGGWRYYFRGVMVGDGRRRASKPLRAAQDEAGVPPGVWRGRGLASVGLAAGDVVTERQAQLLLGEGRHPDADRIERELLAQGVSLGKARRATVTGQAHRAQPVAGDGGRQGAVAVAGDGPGVPGAVDRAGLVGADG